MSLGIIALIAGILVGYSNSTIRNILFGASLAWAIYFFCDYYSTGGWSVAAFNANYSFMKGVVVYLLYLNYIAGLVAAYFLVFNFIRNRAIIIISLLIIGIIPIWLNRDNNAADINKTPVTNINQNIQQTTKPVAPTTVNKTTKKNAVLLDNLNGSTLGIASGITYSDGEADKVANFRLEQESRIQYKLPKQGTLLMRILVNNGYNYSNFKLTNNTEDATIFTTTGADQWWPGSTWLSVNNNGKVTFDMSTSFGATKPKQMVESAAGFSFNQWHELGISFGSKGQHIYLDGQLVASNPNNKQTMGYGGDAANPNAPCDKAILGHWHSCIFAHNQFESGFNGQVDKVKISDKQLDWGWTTE